MKTNEGNEECVYSTLNKQILTQLHLSLFATNTPDNYSHQLQTEFQQEEFTSNSCEMEVLAVAFSLQLPGSEWEIGSEEHSPQVEAQSNVGKCGEEAVIAEPVERECVQ